MQYRHLGRTGLTVSALGLGTGGMNRLGQKQGRPAEDSIKLVRHALDLGINVFDTAPSYMDSEALLGRALEGVPRDSYVLATKFHPVRQGELPEPAALRRSLEDSLRKLKTDHVDALLLHSIEQPLYEQIVDRFVEPLHAVRDAGLARCVGMSDSFERDHQHESARKAIESGAFDVVMVGFNLLSPSAVQTVLPLAHERQVGVMAICAVRSVISDPALLAGTLRQWKAEGLLAADAVPDDAPLDWLLGPEVESLTDAAYKFAANQPGVSCVMTGSANLEHLSGNVRAVAGPPLPSEAVSRLLELFGPVGRPASHPDFEQRRV